MTKQTVLKIASLLMIVSSSISLGIGITDGLDFSQQIFTLLTLGVGIAFNFMRVKNK